MTIRIILFLLTSIVTGCYSQNSVQTNQIIRSSTEKIGVISNTGKLLIDTIYLSIGVPYGLGHKVLPPKEENFKYDSPIEYYLVLDSERKSAIFDKNGEKVFGFVDCSKLEIDDHTKTIVKIIQEPDNTLRNYLYGFDGNLIFEQSFENVGYINQSDLIALIAEDGSKKEYYLYNIKTKNKLGPYTHFNIYNKDASPPLGMDKIKFEKYTKLNIITIRQKIGNKDVWGAIDLNGQELLPTQYQGIVPIPWKETLLENPRMPSIVNFYFYAYPLDDYKKMFLFDNEMKIYEYNDSGNKIRKVE